MAIINSLCVFCGSKTGDNPAYSAAAQLLGEEMAKRHIRLVYGGGRIGLMGIVADAVTQAGGDVIGVIPEFLEQLEVGNHSASELIITDSMHTRKQKMFELSDGFVSLPGGLGTLDETFEILTWKQLRQHDKPVVMLNIEGYWNPFIALVEANILGGFAHPAVTDLYTVADTVESVFPALENAPQPQDVVLTSHL